MEKFAPTPEENAEIDWLNAQKQSIDSTTNKPVTWDKLSMAILGRTSSTLTLIATRKYNAPYGPHVEKIRRYRLQQEGKRERAKGRIVHPGFVELPTSRHILTLLEKASDGKVVLICSDSGFSKTHVANHFKKTGAANVFMMTMDEATGGLAGMLAKVLGTMTKSEPRGSRLSMNTQILARLTGAKATLIFDEASTLTTESFEQIRHWQDATGCGVAFLGNRDLHLKISGMKRTVSFARVNSRIDYRLPLDRDLSQDIPLYLDAYGIRNRDVRNVLTRIGLNRYCGGLRDIDKTLTAASEIAVSEEAEINIDHLYAALEVRGLNANGMGA
jgi:DNA transposition AAA+ family ATPase